jgi:hypothetical protein
VDQRWYYCRQVLVKDIYPGMLGSIYPGSAQLSQAIIALSKSVPLAASDGLGTILVQDILPGPGSSTPQRFLQSANQVFFTAFYLVHGTGLWVVPLSALDVSLEEQLGRYWRKSMKRWAVLIRPSQRG